jgi:hypothetical protein
LQDGKTLEGKAKGEKASQERYMAEKLQGMGFAIGSTSATT